MLKARESAPFRGGVVKCALVLALALWVTPAKAQNIPCGPAADVETFLRDQGLKPTAKGTLMDGDVLEAWEGPTTIVLSILVKDHPDGLFRCLVRELPIKRKGSGA